MADRLPLSVIIPTKNRPNDLDLTVESILNQTCLPLQLVIVDQSETSDSQLRVERRCAKSAAFGQHGARLSYIRDDKIPSGAIARNRAMDIAEGDIWLFLDDDVCLEPNFLEQMQRAYQEHPEACGISGIITNYPRPPWAFRLWSAVFVRGHFHDDRQPVYWNAGSPLNADPVRVTRLGGGLMSFRAQAIHGLRFDEHLVGVSDGEDVDFCARLGSEAVLLIAPWARLVHKQSPCGRMTDHWLRRSVRASWFLYKRNWGKGVRNRISFVWLNLGYAMVATFSSLRQLCPEPWAAFLRGVRDTQQFTARGRSM